MRSIVAIALIALWGCDESPESNGPGETPSAAEDDGAERERDGSAVQAHGYTLIGGEGLGRGPDGGVTYGTLAKPGRVGDYEIPAGTLVAFDEEGRPRRMRHSSETIELGPYSAAPDAAIELGPDGRATLFCLAEDRRIGENRYAAGTALKLEPDGGVGRVSMTYYGRRELKALRVHLPHEIGCDPEGRPAEGEPEREHAPVTNEKRWRERVRDAVNGQLPELDRCFALHEGEARGTLVWVQVNGSREVTAVDVPRGTPDGLARCIEGGVRSWHIEVGDAPGADLSLSFVLEACEGARDCLRAWERRSDGP